MVNHVKSSQCWIIGVKINICASKIATSAPIVPCNSAMFRQYKPKFTSDHLQFSFAWETQFVAPTRPPCNIGSMDTLIALKPSLHSPRHRIGNLNSPFCSKTCVQPPPYCCSAKIWQERVFGGLKTYIFGRWKTRWETWKVTNIGTSKPQLGDNKHIMPTYMYIYMYVCMYTHIFGRMWNLQFYVYCICH